MHKNIKMIGLDLDGTLLTSEKKLTAYTREVLQKAIAQGVVVLVATGRPFSAVPEELRTFPGMRYAVTANGARVLDLQENKVLYENLIPVETAEKVLDILSDYDAVQEVFVDGNGYTKADCLENRYEYFLDRHMADYFMNSRVAVKNVKEKLLELNKPADKTQGVFKFRADMEEVKKRLQDIEEITITGAFDKNIEVSREGTDKGTGLLKLGELLGIKQEEIMACGDAMNDYEMLKKVGFAVVMENGDEELKAFADYVTVTNDEDGVAKAIERFVLKKEGE